MHRWKLPIAILATAVVTASAPAVAKHVARYARNAGKLGGVQADEFARRCTSASLVGAALVPSDMSSDWGQVPGFVDVQRLPDNCVGSGVLARRVATGTYQVDVIPAIAGPALQDCDPDTAQVPGPVTVTIGSPSVVAETVPLVAHYNVACDEERERVLEMRIFDLDGIPRDAGFSVTIAALSR